MTLSPQQQEEMQAELALESLHQQEDVAQIAREGGPDMQERIQDCERRYRVRFNQITKPILERE